ncbi:MAG: hypothetical protein DRP09_13685 [Candidatus Thorarchaeota archaeon]|nr:MAG: hypothetical protein DRP09_13685 [Candidatus Thorarchaeota archaeon]
MMKEWETICEAFVDEFNTQSKIVKLKLKEVRGAVAVFEASFEFQDPYINSEPYREGYAFVYLSEKFYRDVEAMCERIFGEKPGWNNSRTVFWVRREEK